MENSINNNKRYLFLDIMKVIALILMPCIHAFNVLTGFELVGDNFPSELISNQMGVIYLIVPGVFMFCMGAGIVLSKKQNAKELLSRGLKLLLIGLILNVARASIYIWFGILEDKSSFLDFWYWLWGSDILYFAGLYFILFALFRKLKFNDIAILITSVIMLVISHLILPVSVENQTLIEILGNFVYIDIDSCFPVLSWTVFPTAGYLFMKYLQKSDKKICYVLLTGSISCVVLGATVAILKLADNLLPRYFLWGEKEFIMDIPSAIIAISIAIIYASINFAVFSKVKSNSFTDFISKISANINTIYCIHWVLMTYTGFVWLEFIENRVDFPASPYIIGVIIFAISAIFASIYQKKKTNLKISKSKK